jgi:hypothetical protein
VRAVRIGVEIILPECNDVSNLGIGGIDAAGYIERDVLLLSGKAARREKQKK